MSSAEPARRRHEGGRRDEGLSDAGAHALESLLSRDAQLGLEAQQRSCEISWSWGGVRGANATSFSPPSAIQEGATRRPRLSSYAGPDLSFRTPTPLRSRRRWMIGSSAMVEDEGTKPKGMPTKPESRSIKEGAQTPPPRPSAPPSRPASSRRQPPSAPPNRGRGRG